MAEGVRIRHHTRRSQMLPVPLLHKPMLPGFYCHVCDSHHQCKVLHLNLDGEGAILVSREIWADLRRTTNDGGFSLVNAVPKPPAQYVTHQEPFRIPIRGIELQGTLAEQREGRVQYSLPGGVITNPEGQPDSRMVPLEDYYVAMEQRGVTLDDAKDRLIDALLRGH